MYRKDIFSSNLNLISYDKFNEFAVITKSLFSQGPLWKKTTTQEQNPSLTSSVFSKLPLVVTLKGQLMLHQGIKLEHPEIQDAPVTQVWKFFLLLPTNWKGGVDFTEVLFMIECFGSLTPPPPPASLDFSVLLDPNGIDTFLSGVVFASRHRNQALLPGPE